jgi:uncharacterized Zn finger protein
MFVRIIRPEQPGDAYVAVVGSNSSSALNRVVTIKFNRNGTIQARCTCRWAEFGGIACCHVIAALSRLAERKSRKLSFWLTPEEAHRQKQSLFRLTSGQRNDNVWITSRRAA